MNKSIKSALAVAFSFLYLSNSIAQDMQEDVIFKAMKDELARSMTDLKLEGFEKPFYISYTISDLKIFSTVATLGATFNTQELPFRSNSARILVGGYEFNDESLDNNLFSDPSGMEIGIPINNDYWGIRRALWSSTDNVYKSAARQFQKNTMMLADQKKDLKEVPHRSFVKTTAVKIISPEKPFLVESDKLQGLAKDLSSIFKDYKEIDNSTVVLSYSQGNTYFVNSEGSEIKTFKGILQLQISAQTRTEKGEPVFDQLTYLLSSPNLLPTMDELKSQTKNLAEKVAKLKVSESFKDEYTGPVLFEGKSVANVFANALFSSEATLMASNTIGSSNGYRFDANSTLDLKVGKKITSELISVTAQPMLKKYQEVDLIGSYEVDTEGVVPAESLLLLENGLLKNLLNDRTVTQTEQTATGHNGGPGVIEITSSQTSSESDLRKQLIKLAKEEGLNYGIIIRDLSFGGLGFVNIYKVNLENGEEELLRSANISIPDLKGIRKLVGASTNNSAHNVQTPRGNGTIVSIISPNTILVGDVDLKGLNIPFLKEEIYISNPLK